MFGEASLIYEELIACATSPTFRSAVPISIHSEAKTRYVGMGETGCRLR